MYDKIRSFIAQHQFAIAFVVFLAWQAPAWFPFTPFEGDALSVTSGCEYTYNEGFGALGKYGYGYWMQPLTYMFLIGLKFLMPQVSAIMTFTIISIISVILLQWLMAKLCVTLIGCKPWIPFLAMLLFPETYALGTFPNATAPALCCVVGALYSTLHGRRFLPWILLLISPLLRLDIVQIYPVYPFFLYIHTRNLKYTAINTGLLALATVATITVFYELTGASVMHTLSEYHRWADTIITTKTTVNAIYGCLGPVSVPIAILGLFVLNRRKEYLLMGMVVIPTVIVFYVNHRFGNAAKHFGLIMPFFLPAMAVGLSWLIDHMCRPLAIAALALIALYMVIGVQILNSTQNLLAVHGPAWQICRFDVRGISIKVGLGIGTPSTTADEVTLLSGNVFYPITIHNIKVGQERRLDQIENFLLKAAKDDILVYIDSYENQQLYALMQLQGRTHGRTIHRSEELTSLRSTVETPEYYDSIAADLGKKYGADLPRVHILTFSAINHRNLALQQAMLRRLFRSPFPIFC